MMSCSTTGCTLDSVSTADNSGGVASAADAGGSGGSSSSAGPLGGSQRQCLSGGATALSMPQWCNTVAFATELRNASGDILYVPDLVFPDPPDAAAAKPTVRSGQILVRDLKKNFAAYLDQQKRPRATTTSSRTHPDLVYFFLDETTETSDEDDVEDSIVEPRILEDTDVIDMAFQTSLLPYTLPGPPNGFAQQQIQIYCLRRLATNLATMMNNPIPNSSCDADVLRVVVRPAKVELVRSKQVLGLASLPGQALEGDKDALLRALQEQREKVVANAKRGSGSSTTSDLSSRPQLVVAFLEARVVPPPRTETLYPSILRQNATSREDESWHAAWSRPMEWTVRVQYESEVSIGPGCRRLHQELQRTEEEEDTVYQGVYHPDPLGLDDENAQLEGQAAHDRSLLEAVRYCRTAIRAGRSVTRRGRRMAGAEEGEDGGGVLTQEAISVPESMVERLGNYGSTPLGHAVLPHAHGRNYREAVSYGPIVGGDVLLFSVGTTNLSELFDIREATSGSESESEAEEYDESEDDEYDDLERCPDDHAQEELQKLFLLKDRAHLSLRKKLAHQEQRASACHTNLVVFDSNQAAADFLKKMYANYFDQVFLGKDRSGGLEIKNILRGMKIFDTLEEAARWLMRAHENWKACGRG